MTTYHAGESLGTTSLIVSATTVCCKRRVGGEWEGRWEKSGRAGGTGGRGEWEGKWEEGRVRSSDFQQGPITPHHYIHGERIVAKQGEHAESEAPHDCFTAALSRALRHGKVRLSPCAASHGLCALWLQLHTLAFVELQAAPPREVAGKGPGALLPSSRRCSCCCVGTPAKPGRGAHAHVAGEEEGRVEQQGDALREAVEGEAPAAQAHLQQQQQQQEEDGEGRQGVRGGDRGRAEQSRLRTDHIVATGGDGGLMSGGVTQKLVPAGGQSTRGEPLYTLAKHGAMGAATDRQLSK